MERTNGVKCSQCRAGASTLASWWCRDALHYHGQSSAEKGSDLHAFSQHTLLQHASTTLEPTVKRLFRKRSIYTVSRLAARVKKKSCKHPTKRDSCTLRCCNTWTTSELRKQDHLRGTWMLHEYICCLLIVQTESTTLLYHHICPRSAPAGHSPAHFGSEWPRQSV